MLAKGAPAHFTYTYIHHPASITKYGLPYSRCYDMLDWSYSSCWTAIIHWILFIDHQLDQAHASPHTIWYTCGHDTLTQDHLLHTEAETKSLTFCRHLQIHFLEWKLLHVTSNFTEICSWGFNWQSFSIDLSDGLEPVKWQAITWTNSYPVH